MKGNSNPAGVLITRLIDCMPGRTELTIGVAVGSSIQIAAGMIPILVLVSWALHKNLTLFFADFEASLNFLRSAMRSPHPLTPWLAHSATVRLSCYLSLVRVDPLTLKNLLTRDVITVVLVNILLQDGRSNYIEGIMLIALYLVIALSYLAA